MPRLALACVVLLTTAGAASAQEAWEGFNARISVNAGVQVGTPGVSEAINLEKYLEPAPLSAIVPSAMMPFVDGGLAVRLWRDLGAALSVSSAERSGSADVSAQIPHPFFFRRPRAISGQAGDVTHQEIAAHADAVYLLGSPQLDLMLSAGASLFHVSQDLVSDVEYSETYPYDTATFVSADLQRVSRSKVGYNAGVDLIWKLSPVWGVGALLRYSRATVPIDREGATAATLKAGGLQGGLGLRLIF